MRWKMTAWMLLGMGIVSLGWVLSPFAQTAPATKTIILHWECTGTCLDATTFTAYRQQNCTGAWVAMTTIPAPATSMQVSSSTTKNDCWSVTAKTATAGTESARSNAARWPIHFPGGFPIRLRWNAPTDGDVAVASYRVYKQPGCTGSFSLFATVAAPELSYLILPPVSALDCWQVSAVASDTSEGPSSTTFQISTNIMGGTPYILRGGGH